MTGDQRNIYARTMTATRSAHLLAPTDPIPPGAFFVEVRYFSPEGPWTPQIDGAAVASIDNGVLAAPATQGSGRYPLPDETRIATVLAGWGVTADTPILIYAVDPEEAKVATRAWFVLRHAGMRDVRVIDGGINGWQARRHPQAARLRELPHAPAPAAHAGVFALDADGAAAVGASGTLLDARGARAHASGHIPGAVSAPGEHVFRNGWLLPETELRTWVEPLIPTGTASVGAYCGGGVAASGIVFALATLGIVTGLYVDSWTQWSRDPERPVETH